MTTRKREEKVKKNSWEKEFSEKFTDNVLKNGYGNDLITGEASDIMEFIHRIRDEAYKEGLLKKIEKETPMTLAKGREKCGFTHILLLKLFPIK